MAGGFETIILEDNLNPIVKLEPLTSYVDDHKENNSNANYSTAAEESKIGEIFHVTKDHFKFVCVHCFAEFPLLLQFAAHAQQHLQEIYSEVFDTKSFNEFDAVDDVKPLQLNCVAGPSSAAEWQCDDVAGSPPPKKKSIKCTDCYKRFDRPCLLRSHRETVHKGKMFECTICNKKIAYKGNMLRHLKTLHPNDESYYSLNVCYIGTADENEGTVLECSDCNETFSNPAILKKHWNLKHDRTLYCCQICNKNIKNPDYHLKANHPNDDMDSYVVCDTMGKFAPQQKNKLGFFKCSDCGDSFKHLVRLMRHRDLVHSCRMYCCKICGAKANYKGNIRRHVRTLHPEHPQNSYYEIFEDENNKEENISAECQPIDGQATSEINENVDAQSKDRAQVKRLFNCRYCENESFESQSALSQHQRIHSIKKPKYECLICEAKFSYRKVLSTHMVHKHPTIDSNAARDQLEFKIEVSPAENEPKNKFDFANLNERNSTADSIEEPSNVKTSRANDDASKYNQAKANTKNLDHHRYQASHCAICNLKFDNKWSLVWHNRNVHDSHGQTIQLFECYLCHTSYTEIAPLKYHFRKKHYRLAYKPRPCKTCGQLFENINAFTRHRKWHKEQLLGRLHKCHECDQAFVERYQLAHHLHKHAETKNFKCDICGQAYRTLKVKYAHMRSHTRKDQVQCSECGKFMGNSYKLKRHMLTHTGETPYECEYCHKRFRQSYTLTIHKQSHTGKYIHYCKLCRKGFGYRRELRKHNLKVHGIETVEESDPNLKEIVEDNVQQ